MTLDYLRARTDKPFTVVTNDPGATFHSERVYDVAKLEPVVAKPHSPDNRALARELSEVRLDRAYIGSCTGGKITDFIAAARILKGRQVAIDTFIVPATTEVAKGLVRERVEGQTLAEIFRDAGCKLGQPSCAACLGGPADTFGRLNEPLKCISTTNRNFPAAWAPGGRSSSSPLTAAASAVTGRITDPREML